MGNYKRIVKRIIIVLFMCLSFNNNEMRALAATGKETVSFTVYQSQDDAREMLQLVNTFRTKSNQWQYKSNGSKEYFNTNSSNQLGKFTYDYGLEQIAMQRARELVLCYMSTHERPDGSARRTCTYNGIYSDNENISCGSLTAEKAQKGFEEEDCDYSGQGHRRALLNKDYTRIGIAHVVYMGRDYWVQEFGINGTGASKTEAINKNVTAKLTILTADKTVTAPYFVGENFIDGEYDNNYNHNLYVTYGSTQKDEWNLADLPDMTYYTTWNLGYRTELEAVILDKKITPSWKCTIKDTSIAELSGNYIMPKKAGTTTMTAICKDSNIGTIKRTFNIEVSRREIQKSNTELEYNTVSYDGKEHKPAVVVKDDNGKVLKENTDYSVRYSNNINEGRGAVVITAKGNYTGTVYAYFSITPCEHEYITEEMSVSSCTAKKCYKKTCSKCGYVRYEYGSPEGHTIVVDPAVEPTCTSTGLTEGKHCSKCGLVTVQQRIIRKSEHVTETVKGYAPTCIKDGLTDGKRCTICGEMTVEQEVIPASPKYHDNEEIPGYEPTCVKEGLTVGAKCKICNEITITQETIPSSERYHVRVEVEGKEPTCTEEGLAKGYKCEVCGQMIAEQYPLEPLGHDSVTDGSVPATCTSTGLTEGSHCGRCGETLKEQEVIPKTKHNYDNGTVIKEVTCTDDGEIEKVCKDCNDTITETVKCTGHDPVTWQKEAATCDKDGHYEGMKCARCGEIIIAPVVIPKGHSYGEWTIIKEATCTEEGERKAACIRCGEEKTEVIPKKEHEFEYTGYVAPTCTEAGSGAGGKCSLCGYILEEAQTIPATGHSYIETVIEEPTCTETGTMEKLCGICGHKEIETLPAKGHLKTAVPGKAATCNEDGWTSGICCTVCNTVLEGKEKIEAHGHNIVNDEGKEATCTESGYTSGSHCLLCGEVINEQTVIPKLSHLFGEWELVVEPTCLETGEKDRVCNKCGFTQKYKVERKGHTIEKLPAVKADCENTGLSEGRQCAECGLILTPRRVIPALGHSEMIIGEQSATCTEDGLTEGGICSRCNKVIKEQEVIPAFGHNKIDISGCVPTCTGHGWSEWSYCDRCNKTLEKAEEIEPLGHEPVTDEEEPATCTEIGFTEGSHCGRCGEVLEQRDLISALGHDYVVEEGKEATCTEDGLSDGQHCARCNKVLYEQTVIPAHHKENIELGKEPTCTEGGYTDYIYCEICNAVIKERIELPALGHECEMSVTTEPTCTQNGTAYGTCSRCHEGIFETIPKLSHNMTHHTYVAPSCAQNGCKEYYECSECKMIYEDEEGTKLTGKSSLTVMSLGHNIVDGVCTRCHTNFNPDAGGGTAGGNTGGGNGSVSGESSSGGNNVTTGGNTGGTTGKVTGGSSGDNAGSVPSSREDGSSDDGDENLKGDDEHEQMPSVGDEIYDDKDYKYEVLNIEDNPTVAFNGLLDDDVSVIAIPSTIVKDDVTYKVVEIGKGAFEYNKDLESIVIGKNIKIIGKNAFNKCKGLKRITIPKNVTAIGENAFRDCKKLKLITVKSTVLKTVGKNAFKGVPKSAVTRVPKKQKSKYKKLFKKAKYKGKVK